MLRWYCCITSFILSVALLAAPATSFAAPSDLPTVGGPGAQMGPSTGTLVAAVMETVGYVSQAQLLSNGGLGQMIERLGALFYLCSIVSAILAVALAGKYEVALWLLVGPPMFHFLIMPIQGDGSTVTLGAEWQFGAFRDSLGFRDRVFRGVQAEVPQGQSANQVSWFFHAFNVVVSDTIQQLVKFITNNQIRQQMLFQTRQQVMNDLFAARVEDEDLHAFAVLLNANCTQEMNAARVIALGVRDPNFRNSVEYQRAVNDYCNLYVGEEHLVQVPVGSGAWNYIDDLFQQNKDYLGIAELASKQSCKQLWGWLLIGLYQRAGVALNESLDQRVFSQAPQNIYQRVIQDINIKLTAEERVGQQSDVQDICNDDGQSEGPNGGSVLFPAGSGTPSGKPLTQLIFTSWMIRKVLASDNRGQMLAQFATHAGIELQPYNYTAEQSMEAALEIQNRFRVERMAETTRFEAYTIAMTLPYIQGAGLYILATVFPFFAMLVLIPGQAGSFFIWCTMWIWFKSWDVGWALVMVADELLWSLMPHSAHFRLGDLNAANGYETPVTIFEAAFGGDSAYNLATYYMLVSAMLSAVPIISANAVLGSKKAIAGILLDGVKTMGTALATHVGDQISVEQLALNRIDFRREMAAAREAFRQLIPMHIEMLVESQMWSTSGGISNDQIKAMQDRSVSEYLKQIQAKYDGADIKVDLKADEAALRKAMGTPAEVLARLKAYGGGPGKGERNKFKALAGAEVWKDGKVGGEKVALGERAAVGEVLRQARLSALVQQGATAMGMQDRVKDLEDLAKKLGVEIPKDAPVFVDSADALKFKDPLERTDYMPGPSWEYDAMRRSIEHQRSLGHYFQGMAEYVKVQLVDGAPKVLAIDATAAALTNIFPGGEIAKWKVEQKAAFGLALWEAGVSYERSAGRLQMRMLDLVQKDYYFGATNSDSWRFYDNVRAGVALREEWWNTPDAPAENRAMAHYSAVRSRDESTAYVSRFLGTLVGNPEIIVGDKAFNTTASFVDTSIGALKRVESSIEELMPKLLRDIRRGR